MIMDFKFANEKYRHSKSGDIYYCLKTPAINQTNGELFFCQFKVYTDYINVYIMELTEFHEKFGLLG
jgi:hypothetical protein